MICAALTQAKELRFDPLAKTLGMSPPTLSKHVGQLHEAGYVATRPDHRDSRRQWINLTPVGREAYEGHIAALRLLMPE
ncbi:transcriptional regulator [Nocardia macrotermitis]|uniref:HTH marR-type domain-containing protein n=1 Tax=Nocardia macrotermitis TaxID=2585198 RepID=A0A7K0CVA6_9NOCA|nr:hypothetical protein [Nocardia macrotermitis]